MSDRRWISVPATLLLLLAPASSPARAEIEAEETLRKHLAGIARQVKDTFIQESLNPAAVMVDRFLGGRSDEQATGGPMVVKVLSEELEAIDGMTVGPKARHTLSGSLFQGDHPETGARIAAVKWQLSGELGKTLIDSSEVIEDPEVIALLFGINAELPPPAKDPNDRQAVAEAEDAREDTLRDALEEPSVFIDGTRVKASPDSPFAVEILDEAGRPRPITVRDGRAFVALNVGDLYAVRIHKTSEYDAHASIAVDGLNMFTFSEELGSKGRPKASKVVVRGKVGTVPGWYRNRDLTNRFKVGEAADCEAAKRASGASDPATGTITVTLGHAWPQDTPEPPDEPIVPDSRGAGSVGTILGPEVKAEYKPSGPMDFGVIRSVISIRYDKDSDARPAAGGGIAAKPANLPK